MRDPRDLAGQLRDHLGLLERHGRLFDESHHTEAKSLAVSIRVLVHDTPASRSLLGDRMLDVLRTTQFLDTASVVVPAPGTQAVVGMQPGLLVLRMQASATPADRTAAWHPKLGADPSSRWVDFASWWERPVSIAPRAAKLFSRRDFVLALANKEGGAHVDPSMSEIYTVLSRDHGLGPMVVSDDGGLVAPEHDPTYAAVRQVAFEMEQTIVSRLSALLP